MARLPGDFRLVVELVDLQDFSYREAAEILEIPMGTVMSRLYRGRRLLEEALLGFGRRRGYFGLAEPSRRRLEAGADAGAAGRPEAGIRLPSRALTRRDGALEPRNARWTARPPNR